MKFYEQGDTPLEYLPTRQWFCRLLDVKNELVRKGEQVEWHPEFMEARISYRWTHKGSKRQDATLVLSDPERKFRDERLQADDHYQIAHGYPGNMSRVQR